MKVRAVISSLDPTGEYDIAVFTQYGELLMKVFVNRLYEPYDGAEYRDKIEIEPNFDNESLTYLAQAEIVYKIATIVNELDPEGPAPEYEIEISN